MPNPVYDKFLDGSLSDLDGIPNHTYGQNLLIKHTKSKILEVVKEELRAMADPMILKEWMRFFVTEKKTQPQVSSVD